MKQEKITSDILKNACKSFIAAIYCIEMHFCASRVPHVSNDIQYFTTVLITCQYRHSQ